MPFDLTKPDSDSPGLAAIVRENFRAIAQGDPGVFSRLWITNDAPTIVLEKGGQPVKARAGGLPSGAGEQFAYLSSNAFFSQGWQRDDVGKKAWLFSINPAADSILVQRAVAGPNPISWTTLAQFSGGGGLRLFGTILGGPTTFRSDSSMEAYGLNAIISLMQTSNPGSTDFESGMAFGAHDSAGAIRKTSSISSKWVDTTAGSGFSVLRLNATHSGGGVDDVALRIFGNHGVGFWAGGDTAGHAPGANNVAINGKVVVGGTTAPLNRLQIKEDNATADVTDGAGQLSVTGATDPNKRLAIGYNTTGNFGWLQAGQKGTAYRPLALNRIAGGVILGAPPSAPDDADLSNSNISFFIDEGGNALRIRVKTSNGTLKTARIPL